MAEIAPGKTIGESVADAELITSYKLYAKGPDGQQHEIGTAVNFNPSERRDMTYNFVIGHNPPDEARDLIPGPVRDATLTVDFVALYKEGVIKAFGQGAGQGLLISIRDQNKPFDVQETVKEPSTNKAKTITYKDCYIADYRAVKDIGRGDIRVIHTATIHFRSISGSSDWEETS